MRQKRGGQLSGAGDRREVKVESIKVKGFKKRLLINNQSCFLIEQMIF
jgi:hypothetical protein